jgi:hypothetical protein
MRIAAFPLLLLVACEVGPGAGQDDTTPNTVDDGPGTDPDGTETEAPERLCSVSVTCPGNILDNPKAPCTMQVVDGDGAVAYDGPAGLELRGRSSLTFPKPQYAVELRTHNELPVWPGTTWRYLADGSDPGIAWRQPEYADGGWSTAPAPIGFGTPYLATDLGTAPTTTYFRLGFTPYSVADITEIEIGVLRNDGVAVYLNGVEILRDNLAEGAGFDTPALSELSFADEILWVTVDLDSDLLVEGENVLAVEMHQADVESPDMRFDLFLEAAGDSAATNLLGMGKEDDWILNGQYVDRALFRNRLAYDVFQSFGGEERYATEMRYCELELNGSYQGIYTLGEKVERDDDRVDIADDGFIVKLDESAGFYPNNVGYGTWQLEHPATSPEAEMIVSTWLAGWEDAVLHEPDAIFEWLDLDSAVDWVIVNELLKNHDGYFLSVHLWKDETGTMHFTPWDFDLSMGYPYTDCGSSGWIPKEYADLDGNLHDIAFVQAMAEVPAFRDRLVERWTELRAGELSEDALLARIAAYDETLAPAIDANFDRWPIEEIAFQTDFVENWLCPVGSYDEEHTRTVEFLTGRLAWIDANIANW